MIFQYFSTFFCFQLKRFPVHWHFAFTVSSTRPRSAFQQCLKSRENIFKKGLLFPLDCVIIYRVANHRSISYGEVLKRSKRRDSKSRRPLTRRVGSNPTFSAKALGAPEWAPLLHWRRRCFARSRSPQGGVGKMPDLQSKWSRSGDKGIFPASCRLA